MKEVEQDDFNFLSSINFIVDSNEKLINLITGKYEKADVLLAIQSYRQPTNAKTRLIIAEAREHFTYTPTKGISDFTKFVQRPKISPLVNISLDDIPKEIKRKFKAIFLDESKRIKGQNNLYNVIICDNVFYT
jgi:hypothetical protein